MTDELDRRQVTAHGLAKAALHLASNGKPSGLELAREAIALSPDSQTFAAYCKASLSLYDVESLADAVSRAASYPGASAGLHSLVADICSGPLAAIGLAGRLAARGSIAAPGISGRILYVLHKSLPYASDGYATRSNGLARALQARGADLVCVTRPGFPYDLDGKSGSEGQAGNVETVEGVAYHRLVSPARTCYPPQPSDHMAHASLEYLELATDRLAEEIARHRPACVVAASNSTTALPACLAAHRMGLPFVYEVRGFWELSQAASNPAYLLSTTGRQERFLEIAIAQASEAVITLTGPMREELVARGIAAERVSLVPNGCDSDIFVPATRNAELAQRLGLDADMPVIGYVGSFNEYEGLDDLVQACAELRSEGLGFRLLLVGSEPPNTSGQSPVTARIRQLAARLGLGDWLIMPGRVPHEEVVDWYSLIDIAPFPRKSLPVTELVSPLKPLEAMAMAKAVVVSSVGGMQAMVSDGQTGLVFEKGDSGGLVSGLRTLLQDKLMRQRLGAAGRNWIGKQRQWLHAADEMLGVLAPHLRNQDADTSAIAGGSGE